MHWIATGAVACAAFACHPAGSHPAPAAEPAAEPGDAGEPRPAEPVASCGELASAVTTQLAEVRREHGYPSIAAGVVVGGALVVEVIDGVADRGSERLADRDTVYQIGSVTKMLVGLLAADLHVRGELDLDAPLSAHFSGDELPEPLAAVTVRQLATHTAGVPRYPANLVREDGDPILGYSRAQLLAAMRVTALQFPPGSAWEYSNFGYGILAEVIERRTGEPLDRVLHERVLAPLGMTRSSLALSDALAPRLARPYRDDDPTVATEPWRMEALAASGNLFSTLGDLARLAAAEMEPERGPASLRRAFRAAQRVYWTFEREGAGGYGIGRFVVTAPAMGARLIWHGGDIDGYAATLMVAPDQDVAIIVLTNAGIGHPIGELGNWLMQQALEQCGRRSDRSSSGESRRR